MSYLKTAILLAGLTGLFMGVGYLIGGASGAVIALVIAAATNLFAYWNSDRMVLSMYGAHEVDRNSAATVPCDMSGWAARIRAATPATCGAAIDVPLSQAYPLPLLSMNARPIETWKAKSPAVVE